MELNISISEGEKGSKIFEQLHCLDLTEGLNLSDVDISGFSQKKKKPVQAKIQWHQINV